MPELPEVETIVRGLNKMVLGACIQDVKVFNDKLLQDTPADIFIRTLIGKNILKISRYGKFIIFTLTENWYLLVHLRMSGHFLLTEDDNRHIHIKICTDKNAFFYADPRKFGRFYLTQNKEIYLKNLGIDPIKPSFLEISPVRTSSLSACSNNFTLEKLKILLKKKNKTIKSFLLSQDMIAGIGNIYADEILWRAQIHPLSRTFAIDCQKKLFNAIKTALLDGIKYHGTSLGKSKQNFCDIFGHFGQNNTKLNVYQREGEKCYRCHHIILRMKIASRSSYFCPQCQILNVSSKKCKGPK